MGGERAKERARGRAKERVSATAREREKGLCWFFAFSSESATLKPLPQRLFQTWRRGELRSSSRRAAGVLHNGGEPAAFNTPLPGAAARACGVPGELRLDFQRVAWRRAACAARVVDAGPTHRLIHSGAVAAGQATCAAGAAADDAHREPRGFPRSASIRRPRFRHRLRDGPAQAHQWLVVLL